MNSNIVNLFVAMRIHHWIKNLFVFIPLLISGSFIDFFLIKESFIAFLSFCLTSSIVYFFNDIIDIEKDKLHDSKKNRPIASGKISIFFSYFFILIMLTSVVVLQSFLNNNIYEIIVAYLFINLNYSLWLKKIAILDIICISSGFVLRVLAGALATGLETSTWLISMTFTLSMLLALGKRKSEIQKFKSLETRDSLKNYSLLSINSMQTIFISCTLILYLLYINLADNFMGNRIFLFLSSIFVVAGLLRYVQISFEKNNYEQPTDILYRDRFIIIVVISWGLTIILSFL